MNGHGNNRGNGQPPFDNRGGYNQFPTGDQSQRSGPSSDNRHGTMSHNFWTTNPQFDRNDDFFGQPLVGGNQQAAYQQYRPPQSPAGLVTLGNWHQQSRGDQPPPPPPRYDSQFAPAQQWSQGYNASRRSQHWHQSSDSSPRSQFGDQLQRSQNDQGPWSRFPPAPQAPRCQQSFVDSPVPPPRSGDSIPHQQFAPSRSDWNNNFDNGSQNSDDYNRGVAPAHRNQGRPAPPSFQNQRRQITNDQLPRSRVVDSGRISKSSRHTVHKMKSGVVMKPRAELICAWCDQKGHPVRDCNSKVDAYGYIGCCPRCNKKHSYDDCNAPEKDRRDNDDTHFLVERRAGKPLVYSQRMSEQFLASESTLRAKATLLRPLLRSDSPARAISIRRAMVGNGLTIRNT